MVLSAILYLIAIGGLVAIIYSIMNLDIEITSKQQLYFMMGFGFVALLVGSFGIWWKKIQKPRLRRNAIEEMRVKMENGEMTEEQFLAVKKGIEDI
jgi:hypothetical protein